MQAARSQGKPPSGRIEADGARSSGGEGSDTQYTLLPGYVSRPHASPYKKRRIQPPSGALHAVLATSQLGCGAQLQSSVTSRPDKDFCTLSSGKRHSLGRCRFNGTTSVL